jgi:hypothetical protein
MDLIKTQLSEPVFAGSGEMGTRMRGLEWSAIGFGPLDQWGQTAFLINVSREFGTPNTLTLDTLGEVRRQAREPEGETER